MNIVYASAAHRDVADQIQYYLFALDLPKVADRFDEAVTKSAEEVSRHPRNAPLYFPVNPSLPELRSCPVDGFEAFRMYFLVDYDTLRVIRILHSKRNVRRILAAEPYSADQ